MSALFEQAIAEALAPYLQQVAALRERTEAAEARAEQSEALIREYLGSFSDQVSAKEALRITGLKSRQTLVTERQRPGTLLTYCHAGRTVTYGRAGCVAYKLAHQHKQAA